MAKQRSAAEIKKLLEETKKMSQKEAAQHIGVSVQTLYKWQEKAKTAPAVKPISKRVLNIVKELKAKIERLEKELI